MAARPNILKKFVVNEHIDVVLEEDGKTRVYIDGVQFIQCMRLLLTIPLAADVGNAGEVNSIDDAKVKYGTLFEGQGYESPVQHVLIDPFTEFQAHCSNIEAWAEHDYDTRLLHSNIAFPLLKALAKVGDAKARRVLDAELGERIRDGSPATRRAILESCADILDAPTFVTLFHEVPNADRPTIWYSLESALGDEDDRVSYQIFFKIGYELEKRKDYINAREAHLRCDAYHNRWFSQNPGEPFIPIEKPFNERVL
jgi:hypothetical protein